MICFDEFFRINQFEINVIFINDVFTFIDEIFIF